MKSNEIQDKIDDLLLLLDKYSIDKLNDLYREMEVKLEIESFSKNPNVRWSESLKKKMIQQAKRKRITPSKQKYLKELLTQTKDFENQSFLQIAISDVIHIIDAIKKIVDEPSKAKLLLIEFSGLTPNKLDTG